MEIREYLDILKRGWWVVVAMVLLITGIGVYYSYAQTPIYESTTNFVVNPTLRVNEMGDVLYSLDTLASRTTLATTYANVLASRTTVQTAASKLGVSPALMEDYVVSAVVLPDSNIIQLTVQGPSPDLAADLANAIGRTGEQNVRNLQEIYELRLVDTAVPNYEPVSPNHPIDITLSIMVGIAGGLAFITLREILTQAFELPQTGATPGSAQPAATLGSPLDPIPLPETFHTEPPTEPENASNGNSPPSEKKKSKKKKSPSSKVD